MLRSRTILLIILLFIPILMLLPLTACQQEESTKSPKLSTDSSDSNEDIRALRVVTDIDCLSNSWRIHENQIYGTQAAKGVETFSKILKYFGDTPSGLKVRLQVLPTDSDLYESELTHLRTEIMAGGGLDVFLMSGFGGCDPLLPENTLFLNPERAMASGFFLPLDDYIPNAKFMKWKNLDTTIMKAGQVDGTQYIFPVYYRIPRGMLPRVEEQAHLPSTLDEMLDSPEDVRLAYAEAIYSVGFRGVFLDRIADNITGKLLINQDELFQRTKQAIQLYQHLYEANSTPYDHQKINSWFDWGWGMIGGKDPGQNIHFVPRNSQGGVTASIETWCAINRNTPYPEDAFYILDILMSTPFQRMESFWNRIDDSRTSRTTVPMFWLASIGCLPVCSNIGTRVSYHNFTIYQDMLDAMKAGKKEIDTVFIPSNLDRELDQMFRECIEQIEQGQAIEDGALRRRTDRCWDALTLMLAES